MQVKRHVTKLIKFSSVLLVENLGRQYHSNKNSEKFQDKRRQRNEEIDLR